MSTLPPEMSEWAERKGIANSRNAVARAAGIGTSTLSRLIDSGRTSYETVAKVAAALGVETDDVFRLSGLSDGVKKPWQPPLKESFRLGESERHALDALVKVLADDPSAVVLDAEALDLVDSGDVVAMGEWLKRKVDQLRQERAGDPGASGEPEQPEGHALTARQQELLGKLSELQPPSIESAAEQLGVSDPSDLDDVWAHYWKSAQP